MEITKTDYIKQYIIDNDLFTLPSRILAKSVLNANPEMFGEYNDKNIDNVRNLIRYIRYSRGEKKQYHEHKLFAEKFHGYLDPDINDYSPFVIPDTVTSLGILNDIHLPFHNQDNLDAAIDFLKRKGIDGLLLNGDVMDCYKSSSFLKDPRMRNMEDEFNITREFIDRLNSEFNCPIFYKLGNHEERIENSVLRQIPELVHFVTFENCLSEGGEFDFNEYKLTVIKDKRIIKFTSHLSIIHGHEYRAGMSNPVGVARWLYMKARDNAACGHAHKKDSFAARNIKGQTVETNAIGCLCHDKETEVLTDDGFVKFQDLKRTHLVAEFNPKTTEINYRMPIAHHKYEYKGYLLRFKSKRHDQLVTPEHKMLVRSDNSVNKIMIADKLFSLKKEHELYVSGFYDGDDLYYKDKRDILLSELIGFIITDGHYRKKCNSIRLYQKTSYDRVKYLLDSLEWGYKIGMSRTVPYFSISAEYGKIVRDINPIKNKISKKLLTTKLSNQKALYEGLISGDGTRRKDNGVTDTFYTYYENLVDEFQILCLNIGYTARIIKRTGVGTSLTDKKWHIYACHVRKKNTSTVTHKKGAKTTEFYDGMVYDITTTSGYFVIRRNKLVSISGNCDLTPKYMPLNDWQSGFALVRRDGNFYKFANLLIENGKVL